MQLFYVISRWRSTEIRDDSENKIYDAQVAIAVGKWQRLCYRNLGCFTVFAISVLKATPSHTLVSGHPPACKTGFQVL